MFEILTDYGTEDAAQNCQACGYHPIVQIFDANQKVCFKLNKDDLKKQQASENNTAIGDDNEVDTAEFWSTLEKSIIFRAVANSPFSTRNPYYVPQSYTSFAPWIVPHSRKGDCSVNTEYEKVRIAQRRDKRSPQKQHAP